MWKIISDAFTSKGSFKKESARNNGQIMFGGILLRFLQKEKTIYCEY